MPENTIVTLMQFVRAYRCEILRPFDHLFHSVLSCCQIKIVIEDSILNRQHNFSSSNLFLEVSQRITTFVDQHSDEIVHLLSDLVKMQSTFPPGNYGEITQRLQAEYQKIGLECKLISGSKDAIERHGLTYPRPNILSMIKGTEENPVLMIGTHTDVVTVEDREKWKFDPFGGVVSENKVWGRGTCDAKTALAAQVFAARAILESGLKLKGSLLLVASVDDEGRLDKFKWPGMTFLSESGFKEAGFPFPDMAINGESSGLENICGSFRGRLILEIEIIGETAHASTPYGINALEKALKLIEALRGLELKSNPIHGSDTITLCEMMGVANRFGDIPPSAKIGYDIRVVPPYSTTRVMDFIKEKIKQLELSDSNFHVGKINVLSDRQAVEIPQDHPLVRGIAAAAETVGINAHYSGILGSGELQPLLTRGAAAVTYGPGHISRAHRANEFIEIKELLDQTKIYAMTALNICGYN
jgi:succinyl-diaminopimelate desuccinylase